MNRINKHRITTLLTCLLSTFFAFSQKKTTITVKVHHGKGSSVSLYKLEDGRAKRVSFRWPAKNDTCVFDLPLEEETVFYLSRTGGKGGELNYVLYLKPGENKKVSAYCSPTGIDFDSCIIVKPNAETVLLQEWIRILNNYCKLGTNRTKRNEFIAGYDEFVTAGNKMKRKAVLPNKYFNRLFTTKIDAEIVYPKAAAFFNFSKRMNSDYDTCAGHKKFYQSLVSKIFTNAGVLNSEHGLQLMSYCVSYNIFLSTGDKKNILTTSFNDRANSLYNDTVRGAFVAHHMESVTNYEQFKKEIEPFKSLFIFPYMKSDYEHKVDELTLYAKGLPGYNFSLYDTKEDLYSLDDFKTKVVVLDVWAMWCAPCLEERPYFLEIEEEFSKRDDIVFLGISVDGLSRKEVWKKFVEKKGWKNIELLSNYDESIMKYYKIEGIPRFMVFDKEGKIISVDAPRPSTPEFKQLIEKTLNPGDRVYKP